MTSWRVWALFVGLLVFAGGVWAWSAGGGIVLMVIGAIAVVTALVEPIYGRANGKPSGSAWRPTDERFVDPESGELVTVWFNPATGERSYVTGGDRKPL